MPPPMHFGDGRGKPLELVSERLTGCANSPTNSLMNFLNFKGSLVVLSITALGCLAAASASTTNTPTPKPSPKDDERGTVSYWQKELPGKSKRDIKALLGTPHTIAEQGAVYNYPEEFFHPDLDEWRSLLIRFDQADLVESFTGEGSDTKTYKIEAPSWQQAADAAAIPAPTPEASPSPTGTGPSGARIKETTDRVEASIVTMEMTEPAVSIKAEDSGTGGTGFVMEHDKKKYIASNIHVLEGEAVQEIRLAWHHGPRPGIINSPRLAQKARIRTSFDSFLTEMMALPQQRMKSTAGDLLPPTDRQLLLSDNRDIALVPVETEVPALTISPEPPKREQIVLIIGNAEATHTLQVAEAQVEQIGPDRFEIGRVRQNELQPGMSGSPVVDAESGEVLGVFTYAAPSSGGKEVRFFAYRVDNLADLRSTTWPEFVRDCAIMTAFRERMLNVNWASKAYAVVMDNQPLHELTPDFDSSVQIAYASFARDIDRIPDTRDRSDIINRWHAYQRKLENLLQASLEERKYTVRTPYIKRSMDTVLADERAKVIRVLREQAGKIQ